MVAVASRNSIAGAVARAIQRSETDDTWRVYESLAYRAAFLAKSPRVLSRAQQCAIFARIAGDEKTDYQVMLACVHSERSYLK